MLLRKLQDLSLKISAYHNRLRLEDLRPDMQVMVMKQVSYWGKSHYDFMGVVVAISEEIVMIDDKNRAERGALSQRLSVPPSMLGLIPDTPSSIFFLAPTWQNRLIHIYLG